MKNKLSVAFLLLTLAEIIGITGPFQTLHYIVKPLLVPTLILLLWLTKTNKPGKNLLLAGLFFSWAGDVFLMLENRSPLFFIIGLVCFLTTHIFYIIYFVSLRSPYISLLKKQPLLPLLVLGYGISLVWLLFPHLGKLTVPVIIYATVICTMLICSLHIFYKAPSPANLYYILGAAAFVLSDSLLAINKFYQSFTGAGILIMLTYCIAQYFIVKGFIEEDASLPSEVVTKE